MVVGIVLFGLQQGLNGAAAGTSAWSAYSLFVGSEAVMRLVLCALVVVAGGHLLGLAWAVALACGTWMGWLLLSRDHRRLVHVRVAGTARGLVRRMLVACSATGASALLLVGYPVLLRVTTPAEVFAGAAPIVLSVSLSRAPLLVPLGIYQNVLVTRVIRDGLRVLRPILGGLVVLTAVGSLLAWWVGPWLLHVVNPAYDVSGGVFAGLVLAAGLVAALTLTGAATVALDRHAVYLAGWLVATAVSWFVLLAPGSLESRVLVSLAAGPAVGIAVHAGWGLVRGSTGGSPVLEVAARRRTARQPTACLSTCRTAPVLSLRERRAAGRRLSACSRDVHRSVEPRARRWASPLPASGRPHRRSSADPGRSLLLVAQGGS